MPPTNLNNGIDDQDSGSLDIPEQPPADAPDKGSDTVSDEISGAESQSSGPKDQGLHAAYPILTEGQIPPDPGLPEAEISPPPPRSTRGAPYFSAAALEPPDPFTPDNTYSLPKDRIEIAPNPDIVSIFITDEKLQQFWLDIDETQHRINEEIFSLRLARELMDLIQYARNEILGGRDRFEEAERYLNEVKYRVDLADNVRLWTRQYAVWLFIYELLWGVGLVFILVTQMGSYAFASSQSLDRSLQINPDMIYLLSSMIWGGFGGVIGAVFALIKHVARDQDFDKQHTLWYITSPLMGLGVGMATFLLLRAGLLSILGSSGGIVSPIIIYIMALLGGYQHNVFTDIVKRMLNIFQVESGEQKPLSPKQSIPVEAKTPESHSE